MTQPVAALPSAGSSHVCAACSQPVLRLVLLERPQPFGDPEDLVVENAEKGGRIIEKWIETLLSSATKGGEFSPSGLDLAAEKIDELEFAAQVAETAMRSQMLGALDAEFEAEEDTTVEPSKFKRSDKPFTLKPFQEAIDDFDARRVVSRDVFDEMAAEAKARAFTVAGIAKNDVIGVVRDELRAAITNGLDLRTFKKQLKERMELRGWLKPGPRAEVPTRPGSPWHVETIYRNGTMASYSRGRGKQMLQPAVLAARPFWEIRTVNDSRVRPAHKKLHGKVLPATDPFWTSVGMPPWGHNCRCRVVSRSPKQADRKKPTDRITGADVEGLPDSGFTGQPIDRPDATPTPATEEVPLKAKPTKPKPDKDGFTTSQPKHAKPIEGVHYGSIEKKERGSDPDKLAAQVSKLDPDTLMVMEKRPIEKFVARKSKSKKMKRTMGLYRYRFSRATGEILEHSLEINHGATFRVGMSPDLLGKVKRSGDSAFTVANTMKTIEEGEQVVLTHEMGHHTMEQLRNAGGAGKTLHRSISTAFNKKKREMRKRIQKAREDQTDLELNTISEYGASNSAEWFAESYAGHVHRPELLRKLDPEGAKMVKRVLKFWQGQP